MPRRAHSTSGTSATHQKKILKTGHSGNAGRSLIERIEQQMDKRRKAMEEIVLEYGSPVDMSRQGGKTTAFGDWNLQRGRYEGLAAALAILRTSSVQNEIMRSNERLGIE